MDIEKEIKKYIEKYKLLEKGEKIFVALSGGKDSVTILYILNKLGYNPEALMIDLKIGGQSKQHKKNMEEFCKKENIPLHFIDFEKELKCNLNDIDKFLKKKNLTRCTLCGVSKRWLLNKFAKDMRADKLVTGHNLDDETQNVLMNFLKGNVYLGINSAPISEKVPGGFVQRVKPLFYIPEKEVKNYSKKKGFKIIYEPCPYARQTYRINIREWMGAMSDDKKVSIVSNFQKIVPTLQKRKGTNLNFCAVCGEPSVGRTCKFCDMISDLVES